MDKFTEEDIAKFYAFMRRQQAAESESASSPQVATVTEFPDLKVKATPIQQDVDRKDINLKNDFIIEERLRSLTSQSKHYEAVSLFENMEYANKTDIGMRLLIAECYIHLGRENKAEKNIKEIEKILMKPPMCDVEDVVILAEDLSKNSCCVQALLLLRIASDMIYNDATLSPDDLIEKIFRCLNKMDNIINIMVEPPDLSDEAHNLRAMKKALSGDGDFDSTRILRKKMASKISERTRVLSLDYGVEVQEELLKKLDSIQNAEPEYKTLKIARAALLINLHYKGPSQFSKAVKVLHFAIDKMEKQFGKNARQHRIYGANLLNIGIDYHNSERYKEGEMFAMRALEAVEYADDFQSEETKREQTRRFRDALKTIRAHIKMNK